jgi:hypothetical protein
MLGPSFGEVGAAIGSRAVSRVERRSSGTVTMGSGLMVSTGAVALAAGLFSFVVEDASPEDAATRFPEQPPAMITTLKHNRLTTARYEIDPFFILHL